MSDSALKSSSRKETSSNLSDGLFGQKRRCTDVVFLVSNVRPFCVWINKCSYSSSICNS